MVSCWIEGRIQKLDYFRTGVYVLVALCFVTDLSALRFVTLGIIILLVVLTVAKDEASNLKSTSIALLVLKAAFIISLKTNPILYTSLLGCLYALS